MTNKLNSIKVSSFRGIRNLSVENLGNVNIITGNNNSGKTSFLEALMILSSPGSLRNIIQVARQREVGKLIQPLIRTRLISYQTFDYLFNKATDSLELNISAELDSDIIQLRINGAIKNELVDEYMINDLLNSSYSKTRLEELLTLDEEIETFIGKHIYSINDDIENKPVLIEDDLYFNKYTLDLNIKNGRRGSKIFRYNYISSIDHIIKDSLKHILRHPEFKEEVIEILRIFDEEIEDLVIIEDENRYIHCIKSKRSGLMPISVYGDGIKKVITLAAGVATSKGGILFIDEIETSVHKIIMPRVFHWLIESCEKFSVQLFLTTHSLEVMDEVLNSNPDAIHNNSLRVVTLKKTSENTIARVLTGAEAINLRQNFDMELR